MVLTAKSQLQDRGSETEPGAPVLKLADDAPGEVLLLLFVCGRERLHIHKAEKETNFAFADVQPMLRVKISFVSEPGYRRWRAIKHLQSGEEIRRGGRRGID